MNCEFCDHNLCLSHYENSREIEVYDCTHCPVLISFHYFAKDGIRIKTVYHVDKNQRVYIWTNNYIKETSYIEETYIMTRIDLKSEPLTIRFPKIMPVTPQNVEEKLSFFLVFS
jgi:hypothetical protein